MFFDFQINYLLILQHFREITGGVLNPFFVSMTVLGEFFVPISIVAVIYWSINRKVGSFLLLVHSFGIIISQFFKMLFCINRPWVLSNEIKPVKEAMEMAGGYSFPSGHTECAMSTWGGLAVILWNKKYIRYFLIGLICLIAFSRNYLGVHTPQDVLASILIGLCILFFGKNLFDKIEYKENIDYKIFLFGIISIFFTGIIFYLRPEFLNFIFVGKPGLKIMKVFLTSLSYSFGIISGWYFCRKLIVFTTNEIGILKRVLRAVFGIAIFLLLINNSTKIFVDYFGYLKGNVTISFIIGIFITFVYPWIFTKAENFISTILKNK